MHQAKDSDRALEKFHDRLVDGLEFCRLAYEFFEGILDRSDGSHVLRERKGPVKQLLEELLPICRYIQAYYGPGQYISVRWMNGNQAYDAKIEASGRMVYHGMWPPRGTLEITQAVHKNEYLMRELLNSEGGGFGPDGISARKGKRGAKKIDSEPTSYTNQSYIADMCIIILDAIKPKIAKLEKGDYPADTTLIVDCSLTTIFLQDEWYMLVTMVKKDLPSNGFVRVCLVAHSAGYFVSL